MISDPARLRGQASLIAISAKERNESSERKIVCCMFRTSILGECLSFIGGWESTGNAGGNAKIHP
jgi:hypothetical protein